MNTYLRRNAQETISQYLRVFPAVAVLGPRQCGKSTLVKMMSAFIPNFLYIDLQNRADLAMLSEPEIFFAHNEDKTICLDEIQLYPHLFSILRSEIDRNRRAGRFILLGSASRQLVQHTSETLAGRIGLLDLTPFLISELATAGVLNMTQYWFRGGYPDSYLAADDQSSTLWRENFIRTYIERDIPQLQFTVAAPMMLRLLTMLAHEHGQVLNSSKLASSLGISSPTVRSYIDILEQTYILRTLQPYFRNTKKRLVKSPRVYLRDVGLLNQVLQIPSYNALMAHPVFGASWEGLVIENVCVTAQGATHYFYRAAAGDDEEMDLVLQYPDRLVAIECKASSAPVVTNGFWKAQDFLRPTETYVVAPVAKGYLLRGSVQVCNLQELLTLL